MTFPSLRESARPAMAIAIMVAFLSPFASSPTALADEPPYANNPNPAAAAPAPAASDDGVGVARLSDVDGDVAIQRGDAGGTIAAVVNAPVLGADYLTTGDGSRAELQFDGNTLVRLGANVQMRIAHIDDGDRSVQLAAGTIEVRLLHGIDGRTTVDTPSISVEPRSSGSYRITVDEDGVTRVTVRSGHADIITPQGQNGLDAGVTLVASGPASQPDTRTEAALAYDSFDAFNQQRDADAQRALAEAPYVDEQIGGVADLPSYGHWADDGSYGEVWMPNAVGAGWAPYQNGNWVWEDSYGWTWVSAEPWGWAPYHYGRWYYSTAYRSWAWYPPRPAPIVPAWSPALVGFVGFGIGAVSVGVGFGNVGWVPLAPFEPFHPWWGPHATAVVNNVTINNYNGNAIGYRNLQVHNALTAVSVQNFQAGRFGEHVALTPGAFQSAHAYAVRGALPIVPTNANLRFTQRAGAPLPPVRTTAFVRHGFAGAPSVAPRTPFSQQQASVAHVANAAPTRSTFAPERNFAPAQNAAADPWSRFNAAHSGGYAAPRAESERSSYARPSYAQPQQDRGSYCPTQLLGAAAGPRLVCPTQLLGAAAGPRLVRPTQLQSRAGARELRRRSRARSVARRWRRRPRARPLSATRPSVCGRPGRRRRTPRYRAGGPHRRPLASARSTDPGTPASSECWRARAAFAGRRRRRRLR